MTWWMVRWLKLRKMNRENQKSQREKKILKEIASGQYRDCYLVYNRKSMDEADSQKNSISYQKKENTRFAKREGLPIAPVTLTGFCTGGIVSEKHSGFKEGDDLVISDEGLVQYRIDRPKFQQMVQYVNLGHFKGIVCLCWDRISRNRGDDTVIRKLMRKGVNVSFAYAKYDNSSSGELHMDIDGAFSQHHSRVTSEKVRLSVKNSRGKGKCTYRAPIGYLNTGSMDHKPHDPERAPIIAKLFELYIAGSWSLSDLARHANAQGLTTVPMRKRRTREEMLADEDDETTIEKTSHPVTSNLIHRILTNPFYTGKVIGLGGEYTDSVSHEALVSETIFDQIQTLLQKRNVSTHYTEKLDHPMRGMVRCADCHRVYTPYTKKGSLYFYVRCKKDCNNTLKSCNLDFITQKIRGLISELCFSKEEIEMIDARASTEISLLEEKRHAELDSLERKKRRLREDLTYLRANRLALLKSGAYTPEGIVAEQNKLQSEVAELIDQEDISETAMRELMKEIKNLSELIESVIPVYDFADSHEKERVVKTLFSELFIAQNKAEYKVKKGLEGLLDHNSAVCCPTAWLSELYPDREHLKEKIASLTELLDGSKRQA